MPLAGKVVACDPILSRGIKWYIFNSFYSPICEEFAANQIAKSFIVLQGTNDDHVLKVKSFENARLIALRMHTFCSPLSLIWY